MNNNLIMPSIGYGTWQIKDKEELINCLRISYDVGYRHIDTASIYENEEIIGEFLNTVDRKEIFVTSKLWNDSHDNVEKALDLSLKKLNTDYLDLYLLHWPVNFKGAFDLKNVWTQMEQMVQKGKVRSIGVANFGIKNLKKLLDFCKVKPVVNQIECHPYLPQYEIRKLCHEHGIMVQAYSPFGSSKESEDKVTEDKTIIEIAKNNNCTPHQVILSYLETEGLVSLPRSRTKEHIISNFKTFRMSEVDIESIKKISKRKRYIDPVSFGEGRFD